MRDSEHSLRKKMILPDLVVHRVVEEVGPVGVGLHEAPVKQFLQTQPQHCCPDLHAKESFSFLCNPSPVQYTSPV